METIKTKVCAKCGKEKSVEYFKKSGVSADGYCRLCNECTPPQLSLSACEYTKAVIQL